jgi:hypothetical protein
MLEVVNMFVLLEEARGYIAVSGVVVLYYKLEV